MNRTKIEWADYTWNPIKGLCPEACWYCYGRAIYQRFGLSPKVELDCGELGAPLALTKKGDKLKTPAGSRIFVCSTMELFHPSIPKKDRDCVFSVIEECREFTFIILTKRPELIDRPMPANVWLGVSVTGAEDWKRLYELSKVEARVKFVSLEPFLGEIPIFSPLLKPDWLIVGRLTGHGKKRDPSTHEIQMVVNQAWFLRIPIFLKNNLKDIWPSPLIQEYPR
jgi:protein gp37